MGELSEAMKRSPNFYAEEGASLLRIEEAEKALKLKFAPDFKECLHEFGAVSIDGHELTGISADKNLDVVEVTGKNRERLNLKKGLYVIEEAHIDGIVIWQDSDGIIYETAPNLDAKKIANSLAEYLGIHQQ
jgi:hypothetical protein